MTELRNFILGEIQTLEAHKRDIDALLNRRRGTVAEMMLATNDRPVMVMAAGKLLNGVYK